MLYSGKPDLDRNQCKKWSFSGYDDKHLIVVFGKSLNRGFCDWLGMYFLLKRWLKINSVIKITWKTE